MNKRIISGLLAQEAPMLFPKAQFENVILHNLKTFPTRLGLDGIKREEGATTQALLITPDENAAQTLSRIESVYDLGLEEVGFKFEGKSQVAAMLTSVENEATPCFEAKELLKKIAHAQNPRIAKAMFLGAGYRLASRALAKSEHRNLRYTHQGEQKDIPELEREVLDLGFYAFERLNIRHKRFDGRISDRYSREVMISGDAAIVLPYDPKRDEVVLIEQMRPAALSRGIYDAWGLEAVAGLIGEGEPPEETAIRELEEEAGLEALALYPIPPSYQSPGSVSQMMYPFIASVDLTNYQAGIYGLDEEQEDIRSLILTREEAIELLRSGEANNAPLQILLFALALDKETITNSLLATSANSD